MMTRFGLAGLNAAAAVWLAGASAFGAEGAPPAAATEVAPGSPASPPTADPTAAPEATLMPRHRITYSNLVGARVNPLGFENRFVFGFEQRLWSDPGLLTRDAYVGLKLVPILNPALARLGGQIEVKPAAVLALRAGAFYKQYFGTFAQLDAFDTPTAEFCDSCMKDRDEAGLTVGATTGFESEIGALAQIKAGPIAVRNDTAFFYSDVDAPGSTVYYDQRIDMLVPDGGFSMTNDTDLLYVTDFGLAAGARLSLGHAFYRDADFRPGESTDNPNTPIARLGPAVAYTFFDEPGTTFNKPTLLLLSQWWLAHRYRTGEDVSQAVPCITLAFRFEGQVWGDAP